MEKLDVPEEAVITLGEDPLDRVKRERDAGLKALHKELEAEKAKRDEAATAEQAARARIVLLERTIRELTPHKPRKRKGDKPAPVPEYRRAE